MFFKRSQPGIPSSAPVRADGEVTTVAARPQPLEASELRHVVNPATLGFKTTDELLPDHRADRPGARAQGHSVRQRTSRATTSTCSCSGRRPRARSTAVRAHLGPKAARSSPAARLGLCLQFREPQPPEGAEAAARARQGPGQGHDRSARRVAQRAAGPLRGRGLPGAPPRHRRAVPLRQRGGAGSAEQEGAVAEHRAAAHAHRLRHGAHARGQGGQARGVQRAARSHAPRRGEQDRRAGEGAGPGAGAVPENREEAPGAAERAQRGGRQGRDPRCAGGAACLRERHRRGRGLSGGRGRTTWCATSALFLATGEEENAIVKQPVDTARDPRFRRYMVNVMAANGEGGSAARAAGGGGQPHLRQPGRAGRAHRPDGHAGHRLPAHQAGRAAQGQRRLSAARCAPAAAVAVRLGGA